MEIFICFKNNEPSLLLGNVDKYFEQFDVLYISCKENGIEINYNIRMENVIYYSVCKENILNG